MTTEVLPSSGPLDTLISYGTDIRRPRLLERRTTGSLLLGVRDGEWREPVMLVRSLPPESSAQRKAKLALPYCTWAGEFDRRDVRHVVQHSGHIGLDMDHLAVPETSRVMHLAIDDAHCLAAFRSASGRGVRLVIRVALANPAHHPVAFAAAVGHVRARYGIEPDQSGSDVARASFVSFDGGLWLNAQAVPLPVPEQMLTINKLMFSIPRSRVPPWQWIAREIMPLKRRPDGTMFTHQTLVLLGRRLALRAHREGLWLADGQADAACDAWLAEVGRRGLRLRGVADDYRAELRRIITSTRRGDGFSAAADKWSRWTRVAGFPTEPKERLLFAIRKHCAESGEAEFFLSCIDAGLIGGVHFTHALRLLKELITEQKLERVNKRRAARQATTYRLLDL